MEGSGGALVFSSRLVGLEAAVEGYRDLYAAGARVEPTGVEAFASVRTRVHPQIVVFERRMDGLALTRDAAMVRRTGFDHFVLQHVGSGELRLEFGGERRVLRAGGLVLLDTTLPFASEAVSCRFHTLSLPRHRLTDAGLDPAQLRGAVIEDAGPAAAGAFAGLMEAEGADAELMLDRLLRPLRSGVAAPAEVVTQARRRERARAFIEANLSRTDLTPSLVARASHTSRATLYRSFEELGGVSEWVLARRLRRLRTLLTLDPRPVSELVADLGFASSSHAGRAFQARYGLAPGALRAAHRAQAVSSPEAGELTRRVLDDMPVALALAPRPTVRSAA